MSLNYKNLSSQHKNYLLDDPMEPEEFEYNNIFLEKYYYIIENIKIQIAKYVETDDDLVDLYEYFKRFISIIDYEPKAISDLRLNEVFSMALSTMEIHFSRNQYNAFNQELVITIFRIMNKVLFKNWFPNSFMFFKNTNIFTIIKEIINYSNYDLVDEIIKFFNFVNDNSNEFTTVFCSIISIEMLKNMLIDSNLNEKLFVTISEVFAKISKNHLDDILVCEFVLYILLFLEFSNLETHIYAYSTLTNLVKDNSLQIKQIVEESQELSSVIKRHLDFNTLPDVLKQLILTLGYMSMNSYDLHLYPLQQLIPFLSWSDNESKNGTEIQKLAAFALCNALATNISSFDSNSLLDIFYRMKEIVDNSNFNSAAYVGETLPKVFTVLPSSRYSQLVQDHIFDTFQRIAGMYTIINSPNSIILLQAIDKIFHYADTQDMFLFFSKSFESSGLMDTILEANIEDDSIKSNINSFITYYEHRKQEEIPQDQSSFS